MMWGEKPAECACVVATLFKEQGLKKILIPGYGYGRNAKAFIGNGLVVTGIEISQTAIELAKKHDGESVLVYHGSVSDMPFDTVLYDGVFCYGLIHLLNKHQRAKLIKDCYNQLQAGGFMVFVAISKTDHAYGVGEEIDKDTFFAPHGVTIFFYDKDSVTNEFGNSGMVEAKEIEESSREFWQITCKKEEPPKS